jgi:maltooligosyltrehalose trehalohydrolase
VWAPEKRRVELVVEAPESSARELPLEREAGGYWTTPVLALEPGALYRYRLDGQGPYPDPASRSQPRGVHGPSELLDPDAFEWTDDAWRGAALEDLVLYELHVGAFTGAGTFDAVAERLPELRDLGVSGIELMPIAAFPGRRNWGYDGVDLFAPARVYGPPDALRRLVDRAHALGVAVLLDVVYNHPGPDGSYLTRFSPRYLSKTHRTPWGPGMNLDGEASEPVRELFIENARHWIGEYHIDGLRVDACRTLIDESPRHLLAEMQARVRETADPRRVLMIAEDSRNLAHIVEPEDRGGWGFDAVWADDLHHQLRVALAGDRDGYYRDFTGSPEDTARTLGDGWFFQGQRSEHFGELRGTDPRAVPPRRFIVFVQNHDQTGNRARGERLHHEIDAPEWRAASALLMLAPETPLLFMGQEWGASSPFQYFTDHDGGLGRLVAEGRRRELGAFRAFSDEEAKERIPDPQAERTFAQSRLDWQERSREPHASILRLYRSLLALRADLGLGRVERGDYKTWTESGALLLELAHSGEPRGLVVVRLSGAGMVECGGSGTSPASPSVAWQVRLTTEQENFAADPRPPEIDLVPGRPRLTFQRPGAVVLTPP